MRKMIAIILTLVVLPATADTAFKNKKAPLPSPVAPAPSPTCLQPDTHGWTVFCATPITNAGSCGTSRTANGTCIYYVSSSSGSDSNNGLTVSTPVATVAHGISLLRNRHPDWLLLKRGDIWTNQTFGALPVSGLSATQPMVIGSYDPSQPGVVDPYVAGARPLIQTAAGTTLFGILGGAGHGGDFLAIVGIEGYNYTADPNNASYNPAWRASIGISTLNPLTWWLIEDCKLSFYQFNMITNPFHLRPLNPASLLTLRRNLILDSYGTPSSNQSSGALIGGIPNYIFYENLLDHNGWNATVSGAAASVFNHNLYLQANQSSISGTSSPTLSFTNNISTNSSAEGANIRISGTISNNLFAYDPIGFSVGCTTSVVPFCVPTTATITNNVIQSSTDVSARLPRGTGISISNMISGTTFTGNVVSLVYSSYQYTTAILIDSASSNVVANNHTVWDWAQLDTDGGTGDTLTPNNYNCTSCYSGGAYPDPFRSIASYYATLAGATPEAVVTGTINNCSPACSTSTTAGNTLNVTSVTAGKIIVGDAVTYSSQKTAIVITGSAAINADLCSPSNCTGTGGTGTYSVNTGISGVTAPLVSSQTLTTYDINSGFLAAARAQSKAAGWNTALEACSVNTYIMAGFGITNSCTRE